MNKATLNLFNAIQIKDRNAVGKFPNEAELTIPDGYILDPQIPATKALLKEISDVVGISGTKANNAFHKSWKVIQDTPQEQLWMQAIVHYMTTYGFEAMGFYNSDAVYIPAEELNIPELTGSLRLITVKGLTKEEILEKIIELAGSGIALHEETLKDLMTIIEENKYDSDFVKQIKNRELKAKLYDFYGLVPENPEEFLRYMISKVADESLVIKNDYLINKIKEANSTLHVRTLDGLLAKAPKDLASIFFRFKPLFLALKKISKNKKFFNRLRKDATDLHKPMPEDYLNTVTAKLHNHDKIAIKELVEHLMDANIFRKIRLAYALKFRTAASWDNEAIMYKVRNGKGYVTDFDFRGDQDTTQEILNIVLDAIKDELKSSVDGKTIYIPEFINYALPATEKQFTGNFPTGTYVEVEKDLVAGIHWFDSGQRVDLDLSTISEDGKIGWDRSYTGEGKNVLFSGDMTSAPKPKGASELFYIKEGDTKHKIMYVNYFNFSANDPVPTKIIVAKEAIKNFGRSYMVDPNNILAQANVVIDKQQSVLGLITTVGDKNRFYFSHTSIGNAISSYGQHSEPTRQFLVNSLVHTIDFKEILTGAGATVVSEKPEEEDAEFIDLSPEALDKTTIINLLLNK